MGLAEKYNYKVVFYLPQAAPTEHGPFRNIFELFPSVPIIIEEEEYTICAEPPGHVFIYTAFPEEPSKTNLLVDGWRQSAKYFPRQGIHITFDTLISQERKTFLLQKYDLEEKSDTTCFLHVRLGDYKILPHHQIDIGSYIAKASKLFEAKTRFLVFSDEAKQYKSMLEELVKAVGHEGIVVEEEDEIENLFLMSFCGKGAIVANSTFSWWGAYFARQRTRNKEGYKACYPTVWGVGLPSARDILPSWGIAILST